MRRPRKCAPASPMKMRAGLKLKGRKPRQIPQAITATSGPDVVAREEAEPHEADPVDGEGAPADGHHAGGEAVEAVDQVDGVGQRDDPDRRDERDDAGRQDEEPGQRDLELVHRHAAEVEDAGGQDLAGHLGRRRHVADVVDQPDGEHGAGGQHDADHLGRVLEDGPQLRQAAARQHGHQEPHEHGGTTAVGDRLGVHRALAGMGDVAHPQRDALGRDRQRGRRPRGDHQDQAVPADVGHALAHEIGIRREGGAQRGDLRAHRRDLALVGPGLERAHDQVGDHLHLARAPCPPSSRRPCPGAGPR